MQERRVLCGFTPVPRYVCLLDRDKRREGFVMGEGALP